MDNAPSSVSLLLFIERIWNRIEPYLNNVNNLSTESTMKDEKLRRRRSDEEEEETTRRRSTPFIEDPTVHRQLTFTNEKKLPRIQESRTLGYGHGYPLPVLTVSLAQQYLALSLYTLDRIHRCCTTLLQRNPPRTTTSSSSSSSSSLSTDDHDMGNGNGPEWLLYSDTMDIDRNNKQPLLPAMIMINKHELSENEQYVHWYKYFRRSVQFFRQELRTLQQQEQQQRKEKEKQARGENERNRKKDSSVESKNKDENLTTTNSVDSIPTPNHLVNSPFPSATTTTESTMTNIIPNDTENDNLPLWGSTKADPSVHNNTGLPLSSSSSRKETRYRLENLQRALLLQQKDKPASTSGTSSYAPSVRNTSANPSSNSTDDSLVQQEEKEQERILNEMTDTITAFKQGGQAILERLQEDNRLLDTTNIIVTNNVNALTKAHKELQIQIKGYFSVCTEVFGTMFTIVGTFFIAYLVIKFIPKSPRYTVTNTPNPTISPSFASSWLFWRSQPSTEIENIGVSTGDDDGRRITNIPSTFPVTTPLPTPLFSKDEIPQETLWNRWKQWIFTEEFVKDSNTISGNENVTVNNDSEEGYRNITTNGSLVNLEIIWQDNETTNGTVLSENNTELISIEVDPTINQMETLFINKEDTLNQESNNHNLIDQSNNNESYENDNDEAKESLSLSDEPVDFYTETDNVAMDEAVESIEEAEKMLTVESTVAVNEGDGNIENDNNGAPPPPENTEDSTVSWKESKETEVMNEPSIKTVESNPNEDNVRIENEELVPNDIESSIVGPFPVPITEPTENEDEFILEKGVPTNDDVSDVVSMEEVTDEIVSSLDAGTNNEQTIDETNEETVPSMMNNYDEQMEEQQFTGQSTNEEEPTESLEEHRTETIEEPLPNELPQDSVESEASNTPLMETTDEEIFTESGQSTDTNMDDSPNDDEVVPTLIDEIINNTVESSEDIQETNVPDGDFVISTETKDEAIEMQSEVESVSPEQRTDEL